MEFLTYSIAAIGAVGGGLLIQTYRLAGEYEQAVATAEKRLSAAAIQLNMLKEDVTAMRQKCGRKASLRHLNEKLLKVEAQLKKTEATINA